MLKCMAFPLQNNSNFASFSNFWGGCYGLSFHLFIQKLLQNAYQKLSWAGLPIPKTIFKVQPLPHTFSVKTQVCIWFQTRLSTKLMILIVNNRALKPRKLPLNTIEVLSLQQLLDLRSSTRPKGTGLSVANGKDDLSVTCLFRKFCCYPRFEIIKNRYLSCPCIRIHFCYC